MKRILLLMVIVATMAPALFCQPLGGSDAKIFAQLVLNEVNLLRTRPAEYAESRLKAEFQNRTDNGAYRYLRKIKPMEPLQLQDTLMEMAQRYAHLLVMRKELSHTLDGAPLARARKEGYVGMVGQNLAASSDDRFNALLMPDGAALEFVKMLVIDKGVPGEGHRHILTESRFSDLGVGFYRDANDPLKNYFVQEFGHESRVGVK